MTANTAAWLVVHTATGYVEKAAYTRDEMAALDIMADDSGGELYLARVKDRVHAEAVLAWCSLLAFGTWSLVRTDIYKRDGLFVESCPDVGKFIGYAGARAAAVAFNAAHEDEGFVWELVPEHPDARDGLAALRRYVVAIQASKDLSRWPCFGDDIRPYTRRRGGRCVTVWRAV
ncbi:hypothetical protein K1426_004189 [Escherichia coli]|nr:hypothetical protein [Escherichia coli]EHY1765110.1 hypothetical protein [Escherichia coli]